MAASVAAKTVQYNWAITNFTQSPDGVQRYAFGINGAPGYNTPINVDIGDQVILSVTNNLEDPTSIHIHGLSQNGTTFMDGPAGISQCGIAPGRTYVYSFTVAGQSGTYWWHAHNKAHYMDGLRGPFIINDPTESKAYTNDVVLQLTDWYHSQSDDLVNAYLNGASNPSGAEPIWDTGLLNGFGKYDCAYAGGYSCSTATQSNWTWTAQPNSVTRLRLINTSGFAAFLFQIDGHNLTVIEVDGVLVEPYTVDMITINIAQRYSVLVTADQESGNYLIRADMYHGDPWTISMTMPAGTNTNVTGILNYAGIATSDRVMEVATIDAPLVLDDMQLVPLEAIEAPSPTSSDLTLLFEFTYQQMVSDTHQKYYIKASTLSDSAWNTDFTSSFSPSANATPVLIDSVQNSNGANWQAPAWANTIQITKGQVVDIIVRNDDVGEHPFHLHAHTFWVLSKGVANSVASIPRTYNLTNPLRRDTITVPAAPQDSSGGIIPSTNTVDGGEATSTDASLPSGDEDGSWFGYAVLRFVADNPGVWLFHCHVEWHIQSGLVMTFIESLADLQQLQLPSQTEQTCKDYQAWLLNPSSSSATDLRYGGWVSAVAVAALTSLFQKITAIKVKLEIEHKTQVGARHLLPNLTDPGLKEQCENAIVESEKRTGYLEAELHKLLAKEKTLITGDDGRLQEAIPQSGSLQRGRRQSDPNLRRIAETITGAGTRNSAADNNSGGFDSHDSRPSAGRVNPFPAEEFSKDKQDISARKGAVFPLAPIDSFDEHVLSDFDFLKTNTALTPEKVKFKLSEIETKLGIEEKVRAGTERMYQVMKQQLQSPKGFTDPREQEIYEKLLECQTKVNLLKKSKQRYKGLDLEDAVTLHTSEGESPTHQYKAGKRPQSGKLHIRILAAQVLPPKRQTTAETYVVVKVDGAVKAQTKQSSFDKYFDSFEIPVEMALELELCVYERGGHLLTLAWFKLAELETMLRLRAMNNAVQKEASPDVQKSMQTSKTPAADQAFPNEKGDIWLDLEPGGRLAVNLNFTRTAGKLQRVSDIFQLVSKN
ncbi:hypothetical protein HDU84_002148 [Entophlyctis sp. JEL0112]|nr:hypothetical protein HDU84_002148 [Entophlyctis sp. JEL0112]